MSSQTRFGEWLDGIKENWLMLIILVLVLIALGYLGKNYKNSINQETRIQYLPNQQAQHSPFYATELFLENYHDHAVTTQYDMDLPSLIAELPNLKTNEEGLSPTLIIRNIGDSLNNDQQQSLIEWMEQGGHLIVFSRGDYISSEAWKPITKRIEELTANVHNPDTADSTWTQDQELNNLLNGLETTGQNTFLHKLGVYGVSNYLSSDNDDSDNFDTELDKFRLDDEQQNQDDAKISIENADIKNNLIEFNRQKIYIVKSSDTNNLIKINNANGKLFADIMYAKYPQAKPSSTLRPVTASDIRTMLDQQLAVADALVENSNEINKKIDKNNWLALNPLEMQKTLQILLKLPDHRIKHMFGTNNQIMIDSDFGAGKLTIINDTEIWDNPRQDDLDHAQSIQERDLAYPSLFHRQIGRLYAYDNAELLLTLTKNSSEIWLFPNVDIDNLPMILWKNAKLAVLGLMLLTLIWVLSLYNKFGKQQKLITGTDTDIFLYFRQIGRYGWDYDKARRLSKGTRLKAETLALNRLGLNKHELLLTKHLPELSNILKTRLHQRLSETQTGSKRHQEQLQMIRENLVHIENLLETDLLKQALLPSSQHLNSLTPHGFTKYTQTLWLIVWLLKK